MSSRERVLVVKVLMSSEIRWSGLSMSGRALTRWKA